MYILHFLMGPSSYYCHKLHPLRWSLEDPRVWCPRCTKVSCHITQLWLALTELSTPVALHRVGTAVFCCGLLLLASSLAQGKGLVLITTTPKKVWSVRKFKESCVRAPSSRGVLCPAFIATAAVKASHLQNMSLTDNSTRRQEVPPLCLMAGEVFSLEARVETLAFRQPPIHLGWLRCRCICDPNTKIAKWPVTSQYISQSKLLIQMECQQSNLFI